MMWNMYKTKYTLFLSLSFETMDMEMEVVRYVRCTITHNCTEIVDAAVKNFWYIVRQTSLNQMNRTEKRSKIRVCVCVRFAHRNKVSQRVIWWMATFWLDNTVCVSECFVFVFILFGASFSKTENSLQNYEVTFEIFELSRINNQKPEQTWIKY